MSTTLARGIDDLVEQGMSIVNLSLGPAVFELAADDPVALAVRHARARATLVVCAAGNWGPQPDTLQGIARLPGVMSVGAVDAQGRLLETSSRGIEGGAQPTLCALGAPAALPGRATPAPGTSFAAGKVSFMAAAMRGMLEMLWHDFDDLHAGRPWTWTADLPRPCVGFADTGLDPEALAALPPGMMAAWRGGSSSRFARSEASRRWCEGVSNGIAALGLGCRVEVTPSRVGAALVNTCRPVAGEARWSAGAGWSSDEACIAYLERFTPTAFASLFGTADWSPEQTRGLARLSDELGGRWREDEARTLYGIFRDGTQVSMAKVV
jgi:hypothetical protein